METHRLENGRFKCARMVVAVKISHPERRQFEQLVHTLKTRQVLKYRLNT
jgi:hypothetical protein